MEIYYPYKKNMLYKDYLKIIFKKNRHSLIKKTKTKNYRVCT